MQLMHSLGDDVRDWILDVFTLGCVGEEPVSTLSI